MYYFETNKELKRKLKRTEDKATNYFNNLVSIKQIIANADKNKEHYYITFEKIKKELEKIALI